MPRAAPKKAAPRKPRKQARAPKPPPAPKVNEAQREAARAAAHLALRTRVWGGPGQALAGGVFGHLVSGERPHWHLLSSVSGGTAPVLSLRVFQDKDDPGPPDWGVVLLGSLAARVAAGELSTDTEQVLLLREGVAPGKPTELSGIVFAPDPAGLSLSTRDEERAVLAVVPVTGDEARAVREWSPSALVEVLSKVWPRLITELDRPSLLQSPRARQLIDQRMEKEGSSLSSITADTSTVSKSGGVVTWKLSADAVDSVCALLKGRIGHQRPFSVVGGASRVEVVNGAPAEADFKQRRLTLHLTLPAARQLRSQLKPVPGTYTFEAVPNFALTVV